MSQLVATGADRNTTANDRTGEVYVVFGSYGGFDSPFNLSSLNGTNGFLMNGIDGRDFAGTSVSNAGDVNGDGLDDILIGASGADPNNNTDAGEAYVVFGCDSSTHGSYYSRP